MWKNKSMWKNVNLKEYRHKAHKKCNFLVLIKLFLPLYSYSIGKGDFSRVATDDNNVKVRLDVKVQIFLNN